jgi:hypothetical protein
MPTYHFRCPDCEDVVALRLSFKNLEKVEQGASSVVCPEHERPMERELAGTRFTAVLRDGPSGGWASKSLKELKYRRERREGIAARKRDKVQTPVLVPNVDGECYGSWQEAQNAASQKTSSEVLGRTSDSGLASKEARAVEKTYEPFVRGVERG